MQVYKAFCRVSIKLLPSLTVYFGIYAVMTVLLGMNGQKSLEDNFQATELNICIQDESDSAAGSALSTYLGSMHTIMELPNDPEAMQDHLYYRTADCIVMIPEDFETRLTNLDCDHLVETASIPSSSSGYFIEAQIDQYLSGLQTYLAGGYTLTQAVTQMETDTASMDTTQILDSSTGSTSQNQGLFWYYQYMPYVLILVLLCGLAPVILVFQKPLLRDRMDCSALPARKKTWEMMLAIGTYSLMIWIGFLLLGFAIHGTSFWSGNGLLAMANSFVFLLFALGLTLFITTFRLDTNTLNLVANLLGLGMAFTTGVFVPQSMLSDKLLAVSRFLPTYWYIKANNMMGGLSGEVFSLGQVRNCILIEFFFVIAIFALAFSCSRIRKRK